MSVKSDCQNRFFLFQERGITDRFFCGNIHEALTTDEIRYNGCPMTFSECEQQGLCKSFATRKEANEYNMAEDEAMEDSNNYANRAMRDEDMFGMEGVDNCLYDEN